MKVKTEILDWKSNNPGKKYAGIPMEFSFKNNGRVFYCILAPIEIYPGANDLNGKVTINEAQIVSFLGYIVAEQDMLSGFTEAN